MYLQRISYQVKSLVGGRKQNKEVVQRKGISKSKATGWSDIIEKWNEWKGYNNEGTKRKK